MYQLLPEAVSATGLLPHIRPHAGHLVAEKWKPLPTSLQSDFLPDDVLFALTKLPLANESLGPSHRAQHIATETVSTHQQCEIFIII